MINEEYDEELLAMIEDAEANGIEITEAYIQNLKDSKDQEKLYKEAYPEANRILNLLMSNITEEEKNQLMQIVRLNDQKLIDRLGEELVKFYC